MGAKTAFGHVDDFISHYIGDYVTCLMEYGELPSLGVSAADQKKHLDGSGKKCDENFAGFSFEDGRPSTGGRSGGGTGTSSGSGTGNKNNSSGGGNKNSSSSADKGGSGNKSDSSTDASGADKNSSSRRSTPYAKGVINRSGGNNTADAIDSSSQKVRVLEEDEETKRNKKSRGFASSRGSGYGTDKYRAITGTMQAEMEKGMPRKPRAPAASIIRLTGDDGNRFGPYSKTFTPPVANKIQIKEDDNSAFSFGFFIRWLIIGAMILAIIVFFGGQIMNYSNSKD